jgi:hypothetical protein
MCRNSHVQRKDTREDTIFSCVFENTKEERFFPNLSFPDETSCVSAHENNIPITIVETPLIATTLFCSSVNCISFLEKGILIN